MDLDLRISRWILEAQRRGVRLERILIHPDDYTYARKHMRFLPMKVLGHFCSASIPIDDLPAE